MEKRVLVTGGAGFIGSFVVDRLLATGHTVRVLDNLDRQVHPGGKPTYLASGAEFVAADIRDRAQCYEALSDIDVVIHAAAAVGVAQSLYKVEHYVDVNVRGTATLLECLGGRQKPLCKLVVLTSMTAYGEGLYQRVSDGRRIRVPVRTEEEIRKWGWEPVCWNSGEVVKAIPTPEDAESLGTSVYALTKRYQEELALALGTVYRIPVVCLRLFNVYGPRQALSNPYTGVLTIFLSRLLAGDRPIVYEDGQQTRDFVSVHDVVDAILAAMTSPAANGQVLNIGSGVPRGIAELAQTLSRAVGREDLRPEITGQFRFGDIRHCTAAIGRARRLLGFKPSVLFEDGVCELLAWASSAKTADHFVDAHRELCEHGLLTGLLRQEGRTR